MSGRQSFDRTRAQKPLNINIYYNINSRNITNNHEVQSHPVSARISRPSLLDDPTLKPDPALKPDPKPKPKIVPPFKKKKSSFDLSTAAVRKNQKNTGRSNNNSVCSGSIGQKRIAPKANPDRKKNCGSQKREKKLASLLETFGGGLIDKERLKKQILGIFQEADKKHVEKRVHRKRPSESTLLGVSTPRNQLMRLNSATAHNIKNIHNMRTKRKASKSERCSYSNSKAILEKDKIVSNIVEIKGIDSSLFLGDKEEDYQLMLDRVDEVHTSGSVVLMREHLEEERKSFQAGALPQYMSYLDRQAIKIQRAWRKYKTNKIIDGLLNPVQRIPENEESVIVEHLGSITSQNGLELEAFLSQELGHNRTMEKSERAKGETLRKHELEKWDGIIQYVQMSMNNKKLSSDQCLSRIVDYFEKVKQNVEHELLHDHQKEVGSRESRKMRQSHCSRQITEFTNKAGSKEIYNQAKEEEERSDFEEIQDNQWEEELDQSEENDESDQPASSNLPFYLQFPSLANRVSLNKKLDTRHQSQLQTILNNPNATNLETLQQALLSYEKKLDQQYEEEIDELVIGDPTFAQCQREVTQKFESARKEVRRIMRNLQKGYQEAKKILQKEVVMASEDCTIYNSKSSLSKCKSDNYLLKTAMNYKKFVEKKEKEHNHVIFKPKSNIRSLSEESNHPEEEKLGEINPAVSLELEHPTKRPIQPSLFDDLDGECIFPESSVEGGGFKLENIMSAELLQYEEIGKKFEEEDESNLMAGGDDPEEISLFVNTKLNEQSRKLSSMTQEDKEDIFEFIFIDITLELITEYEGTPVYEKVCSYLQKKKKLECIPKGVKTNLQTCKEYLIMLEEFVKADHKILFCKHIGVAMGPSALEMLKYMHDEDPSQSEGGPKYDEENVPLILPVPLFETFENKLPCNYPKYYDDEVKEQSRIRFLKSVDHIHHKAIFDSLNQWLDMQRPYGIWGKPFPWKTSSNTKDFHPQWDTQFKMSKLRRASERVVESCSYLCGILVDKQDSVFANHKVSDHYVEQIREDRMSKMLSNDLHENQDRWHFYDDEETEVLMEITKHVADSLSAELIREINKLGRAG